MGGLLFPTGLPMWVYKEGSNAVVEIHWHRDLEADYSKSSSPIE